MVVCSANYIKHAANKLIWTDQTLQQVWEHPNCEGSLLSEESSHGSVESLLIGILSTFSYLRKTKELFLSVFKVVMGNCS